MGYIKPVKNLIYSNFDASGYLLRRVTVEAHMLSWQSSHSTFFLLFML